MLMSMYRLLFEELDIAEMVQVHMYIWISAYNSG